MHLYWTGVAADLRAWATTRSSGCSGRPPPARCSPPATARRATTCPVLLSTAKAERVDGGYRFTGHKMFGSLTPVWTRLGMHAHGPSDPSPRSSTPSCRATRPATQIKETWDTLGMRATRSDDTILEGAFVPDRYIARVLPAGAPDLVRPRHVRLGASRPSRSIYIGIAAARARPGRGDGARSARSPRPEPLDGLPPRDPARLAEMTLELEAIGAARSTASPRTGRTASTTAPRGRRRSSPRSTTASEARQAGRRPGDGRSPAARACSRATSWSGCTATCAAAASIRPTRSRARDRRQDRARHRPRRTAPLGLVRTTPRWPGKSLAGPSCFPLQAVNDSGERDGASPAPRSLR